MKEKTSCIGAKCAKLIINFPNQSPLIFLSKNPPIVFRGNELRSSTIRNTKYNIIDDELPWTIGAVRLFGEHPDSAGQCPKTPETGMNFSGNKLDIRAVSLDKSFGIGECPYIIHYSGDGKLLVQFSDELGEIYSINSNSDSFSYRVECNACCKEDEFLLDSTSYPGWKCVPKNPIAERLGNINYQVKRL